jgi:hypothetical protein
MRSRSMLGFSALGLLDLAAARARHLDVRDLQSGADRYKSRGSTAGKDYELGIRGSGQKWQQQTSASEDNYRDGVTAAIGRGAFKKGVEASGGSYFEERSLSVGAGRFGPGIAAAAPIWQEGMQPYHEVLRSLDAGPKGPKGDPRNYQRAQKVGEALRARKMQLR